MKIFEQPIRYIKGIGPKKATILNSLGIQTIEDVLHYFPRDYDRWQQVKPIAEAVFGQTESFVVFFQDKPEIRRTRNGLTIIRWIVKDHTRSASCLWYNQSYRSNLYNNDKRYFIRGKVEFKFGDVRIHNPQVEEYLPEKHGQSKILPIYPLTQGISQLDMRKLMHEALKATDSCIADEFTRSIRDRCNLVNKNYALTHIHFPESSEALECARKRLIFEELFMLKIALMLIRKRHRDKNDGIIFKWSDELLEKFIKELPFELTDAQRRAMQDILSDIKSGRAMSRLLQGDVGSGKTILAAAALFCSYLSGYQGVIMAPTEILARQHLNSLTDLFKNTGISIAYLVGSLGSNTKSDIKGKLADGDIDILVGTHAVIQDGVCFNRLGIVITDEQHRFGVRQRAMLQEKGESPHILVMSATPIPRTITLIFYGDLDVSIIDQMPVGRKPVMTYHVPPSMRERVLDFVRRQTKDGHQAYIVCPLVDESDTIDAQSALETFKTLKEGALLDLKLGLLHGRMTAGEKESIMGKFSSGEISVLVCTTVVEVGINVAKATVMVIENAERFGMAQLHQLRGRVGRGGTQSYCILIADTKTPEILERMEILVNFNDGFIIAEKDLELRGPGDFLGTRQHGLPEFKIANLVRDMNILKNVQTTADWVLANPEEHRALIEYVSCKFDEKLSNTALN